MAGRFRPLGAALCMLLLVMIALGAPPGSGEQVARAHERALICQFVGDRPLALLSSTLPVFARLTPLPLTITVVTPDLLPSIIEVYPDSVKRFGRLTSVRVSTASQCPLGWRATATPRATTTPRPSPTRTPTLTPTRTRTPAPTRTPVPSSNTTPTLTRTPAPTRTFTVTQTPTRTPTVTETPVAAGLSIAIQISTGSVSAGDQFSYVLTIRNAGPAEAADVRVDTSLPPGFNLLAATPSQGSCPSLPCTLGALPAGGSATVTVTVFVGSGVAAGVYEIGGSVISSTTDPSPGDNTASAPISVGEQAELLLQLSDSPDPISAGRNGTYRATITNLGLSNADHVRLTATLPSGLRLLSVTSSQGNCLALPCNLGSLAPGSSASVSLIVNFNPSLAAGTYSLSATVQSDEGIATASESTTVEEQAMLAITITDSPDPAVAGGAVLYRVRVQNNGPSTADGVRVDAVLPSGFTVAAVTSSQGGCATLPCTVGSLVPGASATINVNAAVDGTLAPGRYTMSAAASSDEAATVVDAEDTQITAP